MHTAIVHIKPDLTLKVNAYKDITIILHPISTFIAEWMLIKCKGKRIDAFCILIREILLYVYMYLAFIPPANIVFGYRGITLIVILSVHLSTSCKLIS